MSSALQGNAPITSTELKIQYYNVPSIMWYMVQQLRCFTSVLQERLEATVDKCIYYHLGGTEVNCAYVIGSVAY